MTGPPPWGVILTEQLLEGLGLRTKPVEDADTHTGDHSAAQKGRPRWHLPPHGAPRTRCWGIRQVKGQIGLRFYEESEEVKLTPKEVEGRVSGGEARGSWVMGSSSFAR